MARISKILRLLKTCTKLFLLLVALPVVVSELYTKILAAGHCHDQVQDCPQGSVGLVLGCSKRLATGRPNCYFSGRMQAAGQLWKSGRVNCLIVSGDNSSRYYNEPKDMKQALEKLGVPSDRIVCDYGGLRTYDSVVRARDIFGADNITVVSQADHAERAVAIARHLGMRAEALNAPLAPITLKAVMRQSLRERAARLAMMLDFIIDRKPTHLGAKEELPL